MSEWHKPCEKSPVIGQYVWLAMDDGVTVSPGIYTGSRGGGFYIGNARVTPQFWSNRNTPRHPNPKPDLRLVLQELADLMNQAIDQKPTFRNMNTGREFYDTIHKLLDLEPTLRAVLGENREGPA